jgi:hypothetical protein
MRKELEQGSVAALPLGKRKLKRNWCLLRSLDRKPGLAEETFAKFCLEAAKTISQTGPQPTTERRAQTDSLSTMVCGVLGIVFNHVHGAVDGLRAVHEIFASIA